MEKAKEVKPFAEKLITLARKGTLQARRRAIALLGDRDIIELEDGQEVKKGTVIIKLLSELGPRYLDRPGGYTRLNRLSLRRLGDNGRLVLLQLIGAEEKEEKESKATRKKRAAKKKKQAAEAEKAPESQGAVEAEETAEAQEQTGEQKPAKTQDTENKAESNQ